LHLAFGQRSLLVPLPLLWAGNMFVNRHLYRALLKAGGAGFAFMAGSYYSLIYPAAVWAGFFRGMFQYYCKRMSLK